MLDHDLHERGAHLDLADACLGLRVRDVEVRALRVVQPHVLDPNVAQLTYAHTRAAKDLAHGLPPDVSASDVRARSAQVVADGGLVQPERLADLGWCLALREALRDDRGFQRQRFEIAVERDAGVLLGGGVEKARKLVHLKECPGGLWDTYPHPLPASAVAVEVFVFDRVVKDRREHREELAERRRPEGFQFPAVLVSEVLHGREADSEKSSWADLLALVRAASQ